jgi:serine/threonine protein kinase
MTSLVDSTISGRYQVNAFLGKGGMAEVYKVWDRKKYVHLAMKILYADLAEDKIFLRRFRREAKTLETLQHPNIVRFYGLEKADGLVFILMDFVDGTTLRKEIFETERPFVQDRVMEVMRPICASLHYAHQSGIIHCDVKPANIMLHRNGTVLLSDFGIARMSETATLTLAGAGTPAYMSPEQVRGEAPSPQMDVYALGVILYEMTTGGERPFTGEKASIAGTTPEKIRWEQTHLKPPPPHIHNPEISPDLELLILRSLSKDPENRPQDMQTVLGELEQACLDGSTPVQPRPILDPTPEPTHPPDEKPGFPRPEPVPVKPQPNIFNAFFGYLKSPPHWGWVALGVMTLMVAFLLVPGSSSRIEKNRGLYFYSSRNGKMDIFHLSQEGRIVEVTSNGNNHSPIGMGDGILFNSDRNGKNEIYHLDGRGNVRQVTHTSGDAESVDPAPYGNGIFFASNRTGKFEIHYLDGQGNIKQVTHTPGAAVSYLPVSTVQGLYFTSNRSGKWEVHFMDENGRVKQLTHTRSDFGSQMANVWMGGFYFVSDRDDENLEIFHMDANGVVLQITHTPQGIFNINPFVTVSGLYFASNRGGEFEIYHLDHGGTLRQVTHSPSGTFSMIGFQPD